MKKLFFKLLLLSTITSATTFAQHLAIGGSFNHLSNGILVTYGLPLSPNWDFDAGIRVQVNTYSLNQNKQHYSYYQCGYAMDFPEYFGLNLRISRKLIAYKFLRLDMMSNLLVTRQSLMERLDGYETFYTDPALSAELTIGLKAKVAVSKRITIVAASGIGAIFMNYTNKKTSLTDGSDRLFLTGEAKLGKIDREDYDFVGLDGLPMMYLGLSYKL